MTLLTVAQEVAKKVGLNVPDTVASSTDREMIELLSVINEMAQRIARGHDWQTISSIATVTGDGSNEDFSLPSDYDRMLVKSQLWSSSLETPLTHVSDLDKWLGFEVQSFDYVINVWTIYGGMLHVKPALATGVTGKYWYIQNTIVTAADLSVKAEFTLDTDVFRLDEQLLKLGIIWQWRENKGLPYAEDMANFEELKERLVTRDKGSRMIRIGKARMPSDTTMAYPQAITP